jgi:hypothetical protein
MPPNELLSTTIDSLDVRIARILNSQSEAFSPTRARIHYWLAERQSVSSGFTTLLATAFLPFVLVACSPIAFPALGTQPLRGALYSEALLATFAQIAAGMAGVLLAARAEWLKGAKRDAEELTRREQSDFLVDQNEAGEWLDFHSLRHTCGAWLSLSGAHPKTVQTVLRHSTPVLTMNRYGHLLPGAEADAADRLGALISLARAPDDSEADVVPMTGTDGQIGAQHVAQQSGRESAQSGATARDAQGDSAERRGSRGQGRKGHTTQHVTRGDATACREKQQRRAWDSNPQSLSGHLISSQAASQFAYPPGSAVRKFIRKRSRGQ